MDLSKLRNFEWDQGNQKKSVKKHNVTNSESEEVFFNQPLLLFPDIDHSNQENRYYVLGSTNRGRLLFAAFTIRKNRIRIISVRDMNKKEKQIYEKK